MQHSQDSIHCNEKLLWTRSLRALATENSSTAACPFIAGLHFALLQSALIFVQSLWVSSSVVTFFSLQVLWLLGGLIGFSALIKRTSLTLTVLLSTITTYAAISAILYSSSRNPQILWICGCLAALLGGIQVGAIFRLLPVSNQTRSFLFSENNGFVLGILLSILLFTDYGIKMVQVAPLLSLAAFLATFHFPSQILITGLALIPIIDGKPIYLAFSIVVFLVSSLPLRDPNSKNGSSHSLQSTPSPYPRLLLLLAGAASILLQAMLIRMLASIISACELSFLIANALFMLGYSVAYGLGHQEFLEKTKKFLPCLLIIQVVILIYGNILFAQLLELHWGWLTLLSVAVVASVLASTVYAWLLPHLVNQNNLSLARGYAYEISGAAIALLVLTMTHYSGWPLSLYAFMAILAVFPFLLGIWRQRRLAPLIYCSILVVLLLAANTGTRYGLQALYRSLNYQQAEVLYHHENAYHRIDVIQESNGSRHAMLNSIRYFGSNSLRLFTYFLAEVPARSFKPPKVLVLGAGSMLSIQRLLKTSETVTLVEIDPEVVQVSKQFFPQFHDYSSEHNSKLKIIYDDARNYFNSSNEKFDLIVFDISAPYYLQTAALHTSDFFRLVREHLNPAGVFSISTSGVPNPNHQLGKRLSKTIAQVFPHYLLLAVPKISNGFLYASAERQLDCQLLDFAAAEGQESQKDLKCYHRKNLPFSLKSVSPLSMKNLDLLLSSNWWRIKGRIFN